MATAVGGLASPAPAVACDRGHRGRSSYVPTWYGALQRAPASLVTAILAGGALVTAALRPSDRACRPRRPASACCSLGAGSRVAAWLAGIPGRRVASAIDRRACSRPPASSAPGWPGLGSAAVRTVRVAARTVLGSAAGVARRAAGTFGSSRPGTDETDGGFEGAYPYLELIAAEKRHRDPLDARVVEAYWLGNDLLGGVGPRARHDDLSLRFRPRTRPREWRWLEEKAGGPSMVHHSFHVLEILPRIGLIRGGLPPDLTTVLERCLVRPGVVTAVDGDGLDVALPPLEITDGALRLGTPRIARLSTIDREGFGDVLLPGDEVAVHWDRVCGRLSATQPAALGLTAVTQRISTWNTTI